MSKKKQFAKSVVFGYGAIGAQIFYSFASIPLALSYLSKAEFGMWALVTTVVGYLSLVEMGMTNAVSRHLMEYKDGRDPGKYGRIFTGSAVALTIVALIIAMAGGLISLFAFRFFAIPTELEHSFMLLMAGQSLIAAINMGSQILGVPLYVHLRQDIGQINQIGLFIIYFIVLNYAFRSGFGIYSMLLNQAVGIVWGVCFTFLSCFRLGYYPDRGCYKLPSREEWRSVWSYSRGVFIIQLGGMLISSMPQLIIARMLGLESGATWAVATRPFTILRQIVCKPFEVMMPMIYDAYIRKEMETVTRQWSLATQMVLAVCGVVFSVAAANNPVFLDLWTSGRIHWEPLNHWMLAGFFYFSIMGGLALGSIGMDKSIGRSKYINFAQAALTLALAIPLTAKFGFPGLMLALTVPYIPGMTVFGVRYLGIITGKPAFPLACAAIVRPTVIVPLCAAAAWICAQMVHWLPGYFGLMLSATCGTASAMGLMITFGVSKDVRTQFGSFAARFYSKIAPKRVAEI